MPTRKIFLSSTLGASALYAAVRAQADPAPAVSPTPQSGATTKPTALAKELASSLQRGLPRAKLSDALTEKVAEAIQQGLSVADSFRNKKNAQLPPPDFIFTAASEDRP